MLTMKRLTLAASAASLALMLAACSQEKGRGTGCRAGGTRRNSPGTG